MMAGETAALVDEAPAGPTVLHARAGQPSIILQKTGFTVVSPYVEQFWQSSLGPTSTALIRHLARHKLPIHAGTGSPNGSNYANVNVALAQATLGVGGKGKQGRSGPLFKSIDRLARFHFLSVDTRLDGYPTHVTIATHVQTVPLRIRRHWPDELAERHAAFMERIAGSDTGAR
jgi:hypothetical protein